jgi:probable O-glycosylation ligase (exosortase A-associated)
MLRDLLVVTIILVGFASIWRGPFYGVLFYLWLAYFRPEQWLWNDWVTAGHFSLIVGTIVLVQTLLSSTKLRPNWTTLLLVLFLAQSFVATTFSSDWDWSWSWWPDFAKVILIGCLIMTHANTERRLRWVLVVIALSLGFEGAKQGWAEFILRPGSPNINPHPLLGDNNGVAMGMFMLVPVLGALARTASSFPEKFLHRFLAIGVVLRGISTYSRGGFLAAGALALLYIVQSKRRVRTLIAVALVSAVALSVMPPKFWSRMETITASDEERDESQQGRLYFWSVAVRMAEDHPFVGVGFNAYRRAYNSYDVSDRAYGMFRAVHSTWFGVLSEMGVTGLVLLLTVLFQAAWNIRRTRLAALSDPARTLSMEFAKAIQGSLVVFVVAGSFLNAQYSEMFWHFVCLAAALRWVEHAVTAGAEQKARTDEAAAHGSFGLSPGASHA